MRHPLLLSMVLVIGWGLLLPGCQKADSAVGPGSPIGRGPAIPLAVGDPATASASPAPFERVPFAFGPLAQLAVYNRASMDVLVFPGAGTGLENFTEHAPYEVVFDDGRDIWLLDIWKEERVKLVDGREVGGFAFAPAFDGQDNLYFLGTSHPDQTHAFAFVKPSRGASPSAGVVLGPYLGKPRFLAAINALARAHGGVTSLNVDGLGHLVVFTTGDGGVYLYFPVTQRVQSLLATEEIAESGAAEGANLDPVWGRYVVWTDARRQGLWVFDRWTGHLDPVPYIRFGPGVLAASAPQFFGSDPTHVVFTLTLQDGGTRLLAYDLLTERIETLSLLNLLRAAP